jgi:hypothetical protein
VPARYGKDDGRRGGEELRQLGLRDVAVDDPDAAGERGTSHRSVGGRPIDVPLAGDDRAPRPAGRREARQRIEQDVDALVGANVAEEEEDHLVLCDLEPAPSEGRAPRARWAGSAPVRDGRDGSTDAEGDEPAGLGGGVRQALIVGRDAAGRERPPGPRPTLVRVGVVHHPDDLRAGAPRRPRDHREGQLEERMPALQHDDVGAKDRDRSPGPEPGERRERVDQVSRIAIVRGRRWRTRLELGSPRKDDRGIEPVKGEHLDRVTAGTRRRRHGGRVQRDAAAPRLARTDDRESHRRPIRCRSAAVAAQRPPPDPEGDPSGCHRQPGGGRNAPGRGRGVREPQRTRPPRLLPGGRRVAQCTEASEQGNREEETSEDHADDSSLDPELER